MEQAKKWKWNQFGELRTCHDLNTYLLNREYQHSNYFHYTKLDVVNSILKNREFWLSNVSEFNDTLDTEQFGPNPVPYFSLCFSTGIHENLPLWYLYSGVDGRGARIQATKSSIKKLVQNGSYALWLFDGNAKSEKIMSLKNVENMDVVFSRCYLFSNSK